MAEKQLDSQAYLKKILLARVYDLVKVTPLQNLESLSSRLGVNVLLKREDYQKIHSFKLRGAYHKIKNLDENQLKAGIVTASAGNHAQGVALSAKKLGIKAVIVMPTTTPDLKIDAVRNYGAEVVLYGDSFNESYDYAQQLSKKKGLTMIPPYDDPDVIAGQGTIGLEILEQLADVDAIIVPIGGGGLISGVAYAVKSLNPNVKIYGVQSAGAPSMYISMAHGQIETLPSVNTFADGIAVKTPGELTFDICSKYVDEIMTVTDDEVATAILSLIEKQKLISEGAGAVSVAAALFDKFPLKGKKVCCLVSGGNIDVTILSRVIDRGLQKTGRLSEFTIALTDKPGELQTVSKIISKLGANVVAVSHDRADLNTDINSCYLRLSLETRNHEHIQKIKDDLAKHGYKIVQ